MPIASINPTTGEELETIEPYTESQIREGLARADVAFRAWRRTSFEERAALMRRAGDILEEGKERWGELMTTEMGKPIGSAIAEAEKCAWVCRHYAEHAEEFLADELIETDASKSFVRYQPLGPILAIMPWNFPFWQVFRFGAPALMAGNVALLKHAPNVPQCALAIEEIFQRAGFPDSVFQTLFIEVNQLDRLYEDPRLKAATLTGSPSAGSSLAQNAGAQIKKTVLELGGSDPFIVMPTADFQEAVSAGLQARMLNNGQSCIAGKRFIVHEHVADKFTSAFVDGIAALRVGDPLDPETDVGPLARPDLLDNLDRQVHETVTAGATVLLGGDRLDRPGNFYAPTVLTDIPDDTPACDEELFGPVASLFRVKGLDEAIELANDTRYGLGASIWTTDPDEQARFIDEIEAGCAFVNGLVKSDPRLPFGGVKDSGYGRELGRHGIREFVNVKTVWIG